jgi:hypothetical protein
VHQVSQGKQVKEQEVEVPDKATSSSWRKMTILPIFVGNFKNAFILNLEYLRRPLCAVSVSKGSYVPVCSVCMRSGDLTRL